MFKLFKTELKLNNNNNKAKHKQNKHNNNKLSDTFSQYLIFNNKKRQKNIGFAAGFDPWQQDY